jgi:nucleoside-diphosphate-sugar epimerase
MQREDAVLPRGALGVIADLATEIDLNSLPTQIDAVFHLAQSRRYRDFPAAAGEIYAINTAATATLLQYAAAAGATRFILASTGTVYEPYAGRLAEETRVIPTSFYSATKLAAEALLQGWRSKFRCCALRLFFPYGPGQTERLIPSLVERIRAGRTVTLDGRDGLVLVPTFVDDLAAVFVAALECEWNGIFNVAAPHPVTLRELALTIGRVIGVEPRFEWTGVREAQRVVPELQLLAEHYDLTRFRPVEVGLTDALA